MGATEDDELRGLQARAYGRKADIHHDFPAQVRLQELEDARRQLAPQLLDAVMPPEPTVDPIDVSGSEEESHLVDDEQERPTHEFLRRLARLALAVGDRLARVRRSTVLIALGLAVIASVIAAALILVERVQPDPLQTGADQVARLSIDPSYQVPGMFQHIAAEGDATQAFHEGMFQHIAAEGDAAQAFHEFYGLRAVVAAGGWFGSGAEDECLSVFLAADGENSDSNSFSGRVRGGCAAGPFPAMTQLMADDEGLPGELQSAFPGPTALQFVYDKANQEIVIYAGE